MYRIKREGAVVMGVVLLLLILAAIGYYIISGYEIQTVYVEGNVHYTEEEIRRIVTEGPLGTNSLYLSLKYRQKGIEGIPFVDVMDVSIISPDTIKIRVYEKTLTGYIKYLDTYMYFDKDGYVVESSSVLSKGVPQILGLEFSSIVVGEVLPVEDSRIFESILDVTKLLEKYKLSAEKIYFNKAGEITLFFGQVKVALGNDRMTLEDKLMLLPEFLPKLEENAQSGTLYMQTYDEDGGRYSFRPEN